MAGFDSLPSRSCRRYRATVSRLTPSSRAIRRCDQPLRLKEITDCRTSILSSFIKELSRQCDRLPENVFHLKMAGFDSPFGGWF